VELSLMMDRILDFPHRDVEHAMIPRSYVDWVTPETTLKELRGLMAQAHTRYPVIDDEDTPVGVVHLSDVLARFAAEGPDAVVASVMRPATVIPTLMSLPDALDHLTTTSNQLACVIDEYGGFAGVLTLEDLAMEIVGEITDEHDAEVGDPVESEGDGVWIMDGDVHLDEVRRAVGHDLPQGDFETIAGLIIAEHGALPTEGETVIVDLPIDPAELVAEAPMRQRLQVDVLRVERHVPSEVRVRLIEAPLDEGEP
jgi:CBS domain containing-hemolysin-like protein